MSPGLLYVLTTITSPTLSPTTYNTWYSECHIPDIIAIPGGPKTAHRYKSTNPSERKWHYLALYPLDDIAFTRNPEIHERAPSHHPILPEGKSIWEFIMLEGRDYVVADGGRGLQGLARWIVTVEVEGKEGVEGLLDRVDGGYARYRIHRAPTAIVGTDAPEISVPRELVIYVLDQKEDIEMLIKSLHDTSENLQIRIQCSSWESI